MAARAVVACVIAILIAVICWQRGTMIDQGARIASGEVERASLAQSVERLRAARAAENMIVLQAAEQSDRMTTKARALERKLREAMHGEIDFDRVLSRGVSDALCLRYQSAAGIYGGDPVDPAGRAHAGESNTVAARSSILADCNAWAGMTVRDAVEWAGLLLDHAGLERLDKQALRQWADLHRKRDSASGEARP